MSAAAAVAKAGDATRAKHEAYCNRPLHVADNSALPRYGWLVQHALYPSLSTVLKAMWSLKPEELPNNRGYLLRNTSITRIAAATAKFMPGSEGGQSGIPMPHRTVAHCLEALRKKCFVSRWEVEPKAATSPFGTSWRLPRFDEILQRWADDPNIGTVGKRCFYVIGKGRWHMTPEDLVAWKINHVLAERSPAAHASAADVHEPLTAQEAKGVTLGEEIDAILAAIVGDQTTPRGTILPGMDATPEQAAHVIEIAREAAPGIPVGAIAQCVASIRLDKADRDRAQGRHKPVFTTVGWILKGAAAAAHAWRHAQRDRAAG